MPRFNALSLFRVPQRHHVGCVAPFAPKPRISITGWLRTERPAA
ncbi:MAG TPA: 2OG-Fe(II) oxygenase family protein [Sphingobium sp.]|nr:2OG-Fe(II) oxygenase family protein [Sphingobium sp.]